jgi:hypothetical protein
VRTLKPERNRKRPAFPVKTTGTQKPRKGVPYKFKGKGKVKIARLESESAATTARPRAGKMPALRLQQQIPRQPKCGFLRMTILTGLLSVRVCKYKP